MSNDTQHIIVPKYWHPWPHQAQLWRTVMGGQYKYVFQLWSRQIGKDTTDIQLCLNTSFKNSGSTSAYIGLDNVWINENIFKKRIDGRLHWADYEDCNINVNSTNKEVTLRNPNTPKEIADSRIKFIGFLNAQQLVGSSYQYWYISESSLYKDDAFVYVQPIWEQHAARGELNRIIFNGTPRGIRNNYYELLRTYTGVDDPQLFPGPHGDCYVDKKTIHDIVVPDGQGGWRPLYTEQQIERLKDRIKRQYGNLNYYYQEYECQFTTVNAGLVYQGIEKLQQENRFCKINIDTSKPVYTAWDISSKGKMTDATACIVFQFINNRMIIVDYLEERGKSLVECVSELAERGYWKYVRICALPWDSERSASSNTPLEECKQQFPDKRWHALERERVDRGIQGVREILPNMIINSDKCDRVLDAIMNYEFKFIESANDWSPAPKHNWASHCLQEDTEITTLEGIKKVKDLVGTYGYCLTPKGFKPYYGVRKTYKTQEWIEIELENKEKLIATPDHLIPTNNGLKFAKDVVITDSLRYNVSKKRKERYAKMNKKNTMKWKKLLPMKRWKIFYEWRKTKKQTAPRCMDKAFWENTRRLSHTPQEQEYIRQQNRKPWVYRKIWTSKNAYDRWKIRKDKKNKQKILKEVGFSTKRMSQNTWRQEMISRALEEQHWKNQRDRKEMLTLWQRVFYKNLSSKVLLSKLQTKSKDKTIKRITRKHTKVPTWAYAIEVKDGFLFTNNIVTHNCCDALRYAVMLLNEMKYLQINDDGSYKKHLPYYGKHAERYSKGIHKRYGGSYARNTRSLQQQQRELWPQNNKGF